MSLTDKEKTYVDNAYIKLNKDIVKFQDFLDQNMPENKVKAKELVVYFDELLKQEVSAEEEEAFKAQVKEYNEEKDKLKDMSWGERRAFKKKHKDVIRWIGDVQKLTEKYIEMFEVVKKKREEINQKDYETVIKQNEDAEKNRKEAIESILMVSELLSIEDPNTKEEATYESLLNCSIDQLLVIMEDNVFELNDFLNYGRIRE